MYHPIHEYNDKLRNIFLDDFKHSLEFQLFVERTGRTSISYSKFLEGALKCPCIREPQMRVCVDKIETVFSEFTKTLAKIKFNNRRKCTCDFCVEQARREELYGIGKLNNCYMPSVLNDDNYCFVFRRLFTEYIHPLSSSVTLLKHLLCNRILFPCIQRRQDFNSPKIFQKPCCLGECQRCALFQESGACIFNCPTLFDEAIQYKWREYGMTLLDNGKEIEEIQMKSGNLAQFRDRFKDVFAKYRIHYFNYKWLNLVRHNDLAQLTTTGLFIQTDYSAQPVLDSQDKLNSVGHGVCVLSCWVILHSPRQESYIDNGVQKQYTFYECDHLRVVTPAQGKCKDQDWFLHCKILESLITQYKVKIPGLDRVVLWTDGAPNQYKCKQNFYWIAKSFSQFDSIKVVHRFGATAQFKGVHDKIGQVAKWAVK